jgi:large subunit ribosomal protein L4
VAVLKKYSLSGEELVDISFEEAKSSKPANEQMIKDYLVAIRANQRQWSANTKTRAEVSHSGQKPHPQKGTGRARQGYLGAPHYKGGGRVFSPRPKFDQHVSINKREKKAVVSYLLREKIREGFVHVLENLSLEAPSTKSFFNFLRNLKLESKRVLFLSENKLTDSEKNRLILKSVRNLPKVEFKLFSNISGYDMALCSDIVILESALGDLGIYLQARG